MQNNISNYIPNWGGKKGSILKQDTERLLIAVKRDSQELIEGANGLKHWKKRRQETFLRKKNAEKWATTIYADDTLSESNGNPPYYPPVPEYTIPEGRRYSSDEIARIRAFQNNVFIQQNVDIGKIPVTTEEINHRLESIYSIDPGLLENTIIHEVDIDIITGFIRTPTFSYPEITSHVGYMIGTLVPDDGTEQQLTHIYVYKNAALISKLLGFLSELKVSNMNDLKITQEYLQTIST